MDLRSDLDDFDLNELDFNALDSNTKSEVLDILTNRHKNKSTSKTKYSYENQIKGDSRNGTPTLSEMMSTQNSGQSNALNGRDLDQEWLDKKFPLFAKPNSRNRSQFNTHTGAYAAHDSYNSNLNPGTQMNNANFNTTQNVRMNNDLISTMSVDDILSAAALRRQNQNINQYHSEFNNNNNNPYSNPNANINSNLNANSSIQNPLFYPPRVI